MSWKVLIAALNDFNFNQQKVCIIEECVCGGNGWEGRTEKGRMILDVYYVHRASSSVVPHIWNQNKSVAIHINDSQ